MENKNTTLEKLFNISELAEILGISYKSTRNKISARGLRKVTTRNGRSLYSKAHLESLQAKRKFTVIKCDGFYTFESKINKP
jgi:DNA-binding transcriptional MerR regulator